jgi:hypothetical protein
MNNLIKLTDTANNTIYINSEFIEAVYVPESNKNATCIKMAMGGYEYTIAKMMDEIMSMINKTSRATLKLSNTKDNKDNGEATSN